MTIAEITIDEKFCLLIKDYMDNCYCLELLRFFGGYPRARFSELAVIHALNSNPGALHTKRALRQLVDKGVVRLSTNNSVNNVVFYSLTEYEPLHSLALDLAKLDWRQWQLVLRQTLPTRGIKGKLCLDTQRPLDRFISSQRRC